MFTGAPGSAKEYEQRSEQVSRTEKIPCPYGILVAEADNTYESFGDKSQGERERE